MKDEFINCEPETEAKPAPDIKYIISLATKPRYSVRAAPSGKVIKIVNEDSPTKSEWQPNDMRVSHVLVRKKIDGFMQNEKMSLDDAAEKTSLEGCKLVCNVSGSASFRGKTSIEQILLVGIYADRTARSI